VRRAAAAAAALLLGCGYSARQGYPSGIDTVYIEMLENRTFRRDLEFALSRALASQVHLRTPWIVASKDHADAFLRGRILKVDENVLSRTRQDQILESSVIVEAEVELVDARTGKVLRHSRRASVKSFLEPRGESLETGLVKAFAELADQLLYGLEQW